MDCKSAAAKTAVAATVPTPLNCPSLVSLCICLCLCVHTVTHMCVVCVVFVYMYVCMYLICSNSSQIGIQAVLKLLKWSWQLFSNTDLIEGSGIVIVNTTFIATTCVNLLKICITYAHPLQGK